MVSERPAVYLAGPVAHLEDGGAGWRVEIADDYGDKFDFKDPLAKYNVSLDDLQVVEGVSDPNIDDTVGIDEIVLEDKRLLIQSDAVLVGYSAVRSIGTPMEVMWAHERDYPIVLWIRDDTYLTDLSPWYRYHATVITDSRGLAMGALGRRLGVDVGPSKRVVIDE